MKAIKDAPLDLVLADYSLPAFSGLDALTLFRKDHHETPFIVVSGKIGEEKAAELMRMGATDFVPKENTKRFTAWCGGRSTRPRN